MDGEEIRHGRKRQIDRRPAGGAEAVRLHVAAIANHVPVRRFALSFTPACPGRLNRIHARCRSCVDNRGTGSGSCTIRFGRNFISDRAAGAAAGVSFTQVASFQWSVASAAYISNAGQGGRHRFAGWRSASARAPNGRRSSASTSGPFRPAVTHSRSNTTHPRVAAKHGRKQRHDREGRRGREIDHWPAWRDGGAPAGSRCRRLPEQAWLTASHPPAASGTRPLRRPTPRPTSCRARRLRRSCRASSTTCRSGSADSLRENPPTPPAGRAA